MKLDGEKAVKLKMKVHIRINKLRLTEICERNTCTNDNVYISSNQYKLVQDYAIIEMTIYEQYKTGYPESFSLLLFCNVDQGNSHQQLN